MGFFSWKCAVSKKSIPHNYNKPIHLILPNDEVISGYYDGYGCIGGTSIFEEVGKLLDIKDPFAGRGVVDIKTGEEFFYQKEFANYASILQPYNETVNDLLASGVVKDRKSNLDIIDEHIKIVTDYFYHNPPNSIKFMTDNNKKPPKYKELSVSENCPYQGFFFDEDAELPHDYIPSN